MIAILDIDGTLIDTNYQHALAWFRAFRDHDITIPTWRLHRHVGMGGDQLITAVADQETEDRCGDAIRSSQSEHFFTMIDEVQPMAGARELIEELKRLDHRLVLASSANAKEAEHYLDLLDAREIADAWTTATDVEQTKPAPDLVKTALKKVGGRPEDAMLIGDTPWDVEAAMQAEVPTLTVLTGGFSAQELTDAGAVSVFESVAQLRGRLHWTPLK